ncbi:MAG: hypothetical protein KGN36_18390 [Acidobacteriota bacterium]|nr:hypothetical protein [Acidobacteriota bacterium]
MFPARVVPGFLFLLANAAAQPYVISTYAGGAPPATPAAALSTAIGLPQSAVTDAAGNLYFSSSNSAVFRMDSSGLLTRVAGTGRMGYSGDGGPAINAQISAGVGLALDRSGNLYLADTANHRVREVSGGIITTVAGTGAAGYSGDGGAATSAELSGPSSVAVDASGNLYIADAENSRIRRVSGGIITTFAGTGVRGYSGDGAPASGAQLSMTSRFGRASCLAFDSSGNLYLSDTLNHRVRMISAAGVITTVAGNGVATGLSSTGDGGLANAAQVPFPAGLALDTANNLFIASSAQVRKVLASSGVISTAAGIGSIGYSGDGGPARQAQMGHVSGVALDAQGNLFIADTENRYIRKVGLDTSIASVAGNGQTSYSGDGGSAAAAQLFLPSGLTTDASGNLFIADTANNRVRKVATNGTITSIAGVGLPVPAGDYGPAVKSGINAPRSVAFDGKGDLFIAEADRIRMIAPDGTITTVAGTGSAGLGDGGSPLNATLTGITGIAFDSNGVMYLADPYNYRIRKIAFGTITTVAGGGSVAGAAGDGGAATGAQLIRPQGIALDAGGNLYIADTDAGRVRMVTPKGVITTVAGSGSASGSGDGGLATKAMVAPVAVAVDAHGNLFICDSSAPAPRVRLVAPSGIITTIAGSNTSGYSGDGGLATSAQLSSAAGIAVDTAGDVYISDTNQDPATGIGTGSVRILQPQSASPGLTVHNAASNLPGSIAPGEIVTILGSGLGPAQLAQYQVGASGLVECPLAGTKVYFDGACAPMIYTSATQVAAVVPYAVSGNSAQVTVAYQGQTIASAAVAVAPSAPAIFTLDSTGQGAGACINQDGTVNTPSTPAKIGDIIACYATGEGQTMPGGVDGKPAALPLPQPNLPVTVTIGGHTVLPQYAGGAPGLVAGVMQVNAQIPAGIATGDAVPIVLQVGTASSPAGVTISVR